MAAEMANDLFPEDPNFDYSNVLPIRNELAPANRLTASQSGGLLPFLWNHLAIPGMLRGPINTAYRMGQYIRGDESMPGYDGGNISLPDLLTIAGMGTAAGLSAPAGSLGIFAGPGSKTADLKMLSEAQNLAKGGGNTFNLPLSQQEIYSNTGWFKGADGKWRYEISDSRAALNPGRARREAISDIVAGREPITSGANYSPQEAMDYVDKRGFFTEPKTILSHPELFNAYPELNDLAFQVSPDSQMHGAAGLYYPGTGISISDKYAFDPTFNTSITLHEMQHAIQGIEGWAPGGSDMTGLKYVSGIYMKRYKNLQEQGKFDEAADLQDEFWKYFTPTDPNFKANLHKLYKGIAGEVEARNTQARRRLDPLDRMAVPPWETEEVPPGLQLLLPPRNDKITSKFVPVDHDPFAQQSVDLVSPYESPTSSGGNFNRLDIEPAKVREFLQAMGAKTPSNDRSIIKLTPVDHNPFEGE